MKKTLLILCIIFAVIIVLPLINLIRWNFQSKIPMDIMLVDKTVPTLERENHKSFDWILTNERFVKKGNHRSYSYKQDYYGFIPKRPLKEKKWDRNEYRVKDVIVLADSCDALYIADTYGVFFNDWYKGINRSRRSRKIYGALNNNDNLLLNEMKKRNKLIIMEYNSFDYPTAQFESERVQEKLGIKFSGWTGKYFSSLDTTEKEFPIWMTTMYRKQYKKPWTFSKPGIVILREKEIVVLEEGTHLKNAMPHIITDSENCKKYEVPGSVAFNKWFDIIDPLANKTISRFKMDTTPVGDTLLIENNLFSEFPAVVQEPVARRIFYFSGDFANGNVPFWTSRLKGVHKLKGILYSDKPDDTRRFFWLFYRPLITGIFSDYYNSMNSKK
jgi:hypothetical protein